MHRWKSAWKRKKVEKNNLHSQLHVARRGAVQVAYARSTSWHAWVTCARSTSVRELSSLAGHESVPVPVPMLVVSRWGIGTHSGAMEWRGSS
jgi:hypothetical protein